MRRLLILLCEGLGIFVALTLLFQDTASALTAWVLAYFFYMAGNVAGWLRCRARVLEWQAEIKRKKRDVD